MNEIIFGYTLILLELLFSIKILKTLYKAGLEKSQTIFLGTVFSLWLATLYYLINIEFFSATGVPQLAFIAGVLIPIIIGYMAYKTWRPLTLAINGLSTSDYLSLQIWRAAFGVMFFFTASLPVWFQYLGGLGDIAAGLGALLAFIALQHQKISDRRAIIKGNAIGIIDFVIVLNVGAFIVLQDQSPDIVFDLIPLYVVPIFILLHIFSIQRLSKLPIKDNE